MYGDYEIRVECIEKVIDIQINEKWSAISMRGGEISISDTYLNYKETIVRVSPKCISNCMELVNGSYNSIRQAHIDCTNVGDTSSVQMYMICLI